MYKGT